MPKVSVIIPTHNRALLLCRAVESVLKQTFQDFEIIVVDDNSTDLTVEYLENSGDERIRYLCHDKNRGEAVSRNDGLRLARGEYIAFLDDDDEWLPEKLARELAVLEAAPRSVGAVYSAYRRIEMPSGREIATIVPHERGRILRGLCAGNCVGGPSMVLIRRACFDTVGEFDETLIFGIDYDMWIRIAQYYEFEFVAEPLVLYTVHNDRLSMNHAMVLRGKEAQLARYEKYFASDPKAFSGYLVALGVLRCYGGKARAGRAAFWRAIKTYPLEARAYFNAALSFLGRENFTRIKNYKEQMTTASRQPRSLFAK